MTRPFGALALGCALIDPSAAAAGRALDGVRFMTPEMAHEADDAQERGEALLRLDNLPMALEMFRQALIRSPESIDAMNGIAVVYDRLGNYEAARTFYETALGIDPESPMLLNNYGTSLYLQGDLSGAKRFLSLAAASGDADAEAAARRTLVRIHAGMRPPAPARAAAEAFAASRAAGKQAGEKAPYMPVMAAQAMEDAAAPGARILRTSTHEVRLVLGPPPAAVPDSLARDLGEAAFAVAPVTDLSERESRALTLRAAREDAAARAEAEAAEALALEAAAHASAEASARAWAESMNQAAGLDSMPAGFGPADGLADGFKGFAPASGQPAALAGAGELLHLAGPSVRERRTRHARLSVTGPSRPSVALLPSGAIVQRGPARARMAQPLPAAEPLSPRRSFAAPFESDIEELNRFAARLHGHAGAGLSEPA
ncbi:tetratricopeptide repeat protein [Sandaracinobacteroides sp. A072]|uniref:tetratricopeptide repeat protein n=1 Tax=Sandaracinobacteroides sp. A072 TaxID=3461146 RepID=UPI004041197D